MLSMAYLPSARPGFLLAPPVACDDVEGTIWRESMLRHRSQAELVQLIQSGGGLEFDASTRLHSELVQLAQTAAASGAALILRSVGNKPHLELLQIVQNGGGRVMLSD
jgi:hypothetical protein